MNEMAAIFLKFVDGRNGKCKWLVDEFWDVVDAATTEADADGPMCTRVVNTH